MNDLQKRQLVVLEETVKTYNSNNRAQGPNSCVYHKEGTPGCAVGRLIEDKQLCIKLDSFSDSSVDSDEIFELLPEEVKDLGQRFLVRLQRLHDDMYNWDESGITDEGKNRVNHIKQDFGLIL
jgi:hypothetical protein